ncbi:TPA: hypothetical protein IUU06_002067 [Enterococcus faecalis]|uniref:hypothetical protein n=1 Tax=Enterococcus faecalis TaxID=1351 RepID=UPI000664DE86|nr:hypothetical protein [Enterococcus faecalis]HAP3876006.1 hypothetical protein [Enterococcus faecalis]HAP3957103.1 hypothetical protein [Enterococcus faecalis]HAP3978653.1 hypothetical protein [Enterococcus faecalis]HAP4056917.1 hypothetical protein [Enterococcus faecalis]HAP4090718.1 hypothetical protein [Enterococcus faecalis]
MALNYIKLELATGGVFSTEKVFEFSYSDYENFKHRFLKRFGNICSNRKFKYLIKNTNDFEELESVFFDSDDWELKIVKN